MKATIRDISKLTGFSPATVSNALNKKKGVNKTTAEKIIRAAKEVGYLDETSPKKIRFVMYKTDGSITDDTPFFSLMMDGFQQECKKQGYEMVIQYLDRRDINFIKQVKELLEDEVSPLFMVGTELLDKDFHFFEDAKCPFLILDYWNENMKCNGILINNEDSARMAVNYLFGKGHCDIGYLRGKFRIKGFAERESGYRKGLLQNGLKYEPEYTVTLSTTLDGAYQDMANYLMKHPKLPTAYFADNDMIALGALKAIREAGIQVPNQVSLVGIDDLPFSEISSPRLSSLRVPKQAMGAMAVHRLLEIMQTNYQVKTKILVCPEFVERDSVKDIT